jgi:uncharacterized protein (DUF697 family)
MPRLTGWSQKFQATVTPARMGGLWRFWKSLSQAATREIAVEADRPVHLALIGTEDQTRLLAARLALETPLPRDLPEGPPDVGPYLSHHTGPQSAEGHPIRLDADVLTADETRLALETPLPRDLPEGPPDVGPYLSHHTGPQSAEGHPIRLDADVLTADETRLAQTLARIVLDHPECRLALARRLPAFRPAVADQLIQEAAAGNAKLAVLSALPGVVPFTDLLLPMTSAGDMVMLTRNQILLLLRIAAAYGRDVDLRARVRELLPVLGSAFGWRALARELLGLVPGGIGVVIKGAVAYAGTYTVGKGAAIFYSTGRTLSDARLKKLYQAAFKDALFRTRKFVRRDRDVPDALSV